MSYFSPAFQKFFRDLSRNNNTEWFNANRAIYEKEVKQPFAAFVDEMIKRIRKYEPKMAIKASDAIFRINKDVRFSKDKTPYNTHMSANISLYGKKDKSYPGFYIQLSHDKVTMFGGAYMVEPDLLLRVRRYIAKHLKEFSAVYKDKAFTKAFGAIQGEKHKKVPPEFAAVADKEPLILNKQFYFMAEIKPDIITKDKLPDLLMDYYQAGMKMSAFLRAALK